jgi:hypothetical protein
MEPDQQQSKMDRLKDLFNEGMRRHVRMTKEERTIVNLPLNVVILGTLLAPWLIGILVLIGLMAGYNVTLDTELDDSATPPNGAEPPLPADLVDDI